MSWSGLTDTQTGGLSFMDRIFNTWLFSREQEQLCLRKCCGPNDCSTLGSAHTNSELIFELFTTMKQTASSCSRNEVKGLMWRKQDLFLLFVRRFLLYVLRFFFLLFFFLLWSFTDIFNETTRVKTKAVSNRKYQYYMFVFQFYRRTDSLLPWVKRLQS